MALTVSALIVLLGHRVFAAVVDGAASVHAAQAAADRDANGWRWLVEAFGSLDVEAPAGGGFEGLPGQVQFATWLDTPAQGFVPRRVALVLADHCLVAAIQDQDSLVLRDSVASVAFDYLLEAGANARWVNQWRSPVSAPLAVRLRVTRGAPGTRSPEQGDTLLLLIGPRG